MKNFFRLTLLTLIFALSSQFALAFYDDVPADHTYYSPIKALSDLGLLPENEENNFFPDEKVDIVDLYELLFAYTNTSLSAEGEDETAVIQTARDLNLITKNKKIKTSLKLSKVGILNTLFTNLGIGVNQFFDRENFPFIDLDKNSFRAALAQKAYEIGIIEEGSPDYFRLSKRITRGELADYLYKIYTYSPSATLTVEIMPTVTMYSETEQELLNNDKFTILLDVWSRLKESFYYRDTLSDDSLITGAIKGMLDQVEDVYTTYETPDSASSFLDSLSKEYEGLGMSVEMIDDQVTIISPFKDSPAEKAGLKPYDVITKVDGEDVAGQSLDTVVGKIKGPAGTAVKLTILRNGEELTFSIIREKILYESVQEETLHKNGKDIGYIEFTSFNVDSYYEFVNAANMLLEDKPDGFIIDLRNNPGGYMDVAVYIIGLFTDDIVTAVSLELVDGTAENYLTDGNGLLKDYKTVVLINEGSASASEIVAGALQDYGYATLVGVTSFGKGSVQQLQPYYDGSLFKYTIAKWFTPGGTDINETGIIPDIVVENVEDSEDVDEQLEKAIEQF